MSPQSVKRPSLVSPKVEEKEKYFGCFSPGDAAGQKEWGIVELQGDLETRHPVPLSGKFIGDIHFTHKDAPVLIIGHHILQGKVITLEKPLAVLVKSSRPDSGASEMDTRSDDKLQPMTKPQSSTTYLVEAIITKKILFKTRPKPIIAHVPKKL
ncbi:chromosome transmission fidelity protein 8-like protein [Plakobranchus ocellatus]|uniref:Chromosome transmission fidelity protein 8-like protein n=1 Tax=Plakobranchus ocellatus TaxID=259542 RepID=A0AAV3XZ97_9GAST|nr:chromosome transmission fidelity protein 8-like protein [Plakobranchus ocellatus]